MTISENIINDIAIQPLSQEVGVLKEMFNMLTYSHLPLEKDGVYIGCISENDLRCFEDGKSMEEYQYALSPFYARKNDDLLDVLKHFAKNATNLLPVLEEESNAYLGYVELSNIMSIFNATPFISAEGGIIVVEKGVTDFSFSEISQIVESNEGKLFGAYVSNISNDVAQITVKISLSGMGKIIETFRRYGYKIVSKHQEDVFLQNLKDHSAYLNKYLNI